MAASSASPSAPSVLRPGDVLCGRYEIVEEIGRGAMGVIFRARHLKLGGLVAVKVMGHTLRASPEMVERFRREARVANRVKHPNVVQVIDCDETPWGAPFFVEEFLEGKDLQARLDAGETFSPDEVIDILEAISEALEAVHAEGIVHRDIKPGNVMIA